MSFPSRLFFFSCSGAHRDLHSFPTRRSSDLSASPPIPGTAVGSGAPAASLTMAEIAPRSVRGLSTARATRNRSEEHTSELQSRLHLVCRLLLEKKKKKYQRH